MTRQFSIILAALITSLAFTGLATASIQMTPLQEACLKLEVSFGHSQYVPHPNGPKSDTFVECADGIVVHTRKDIGDPNNGYVLNTLIAPAEIKSSVFEIANSQALFGNFRNGPGPQRAPPGFPLHSYLL